jgi:replication factor C large subunit
MAGYYTLDAAAVAFVTGSGKSTTKVAEIVADGQRLRAPEMVASEGDQRASAPEEAAADEAEPAATDPEEGDDADTQAGLGEFL